MVPVATRPTGVELCCYGLVTWSGMTPVCKCEVPAHLPMVTSCRCVHTFVCGSSPGTMYIFLTWPFCISNHFQFSFLPHTSCPLIYSASYFALPKQPYLMYSSVNLLPIPILLQLCRLPLVNDIVHSHSCVVQLTKTCMVKTPCSQLLLILLCICFGSISLLFTC